MNDVQLSFSKGRFSKANAFALDGGLFDIGTPVIKWDDEGGFDGYTTKRVVTTRENRRTGEVRRKVISGKRYGDRPEGVQGISQFFVHHSGGDGRDPRNMYHTLYMDRKLSVPFAVEDDGRIYQFNDAVDRCYHGGKHNPISIGVECCLFPLVESKPDYYSAARRKKLGNLPHSQMVDVIHGQKIKVFCFTEPQVEALARLAAGCWLGCQILGGDRKGLSSEGLHKDDYFTVPPRFPRNRKHEIPRTVVPKARDHIGLIGHLQATRRKIDPAGFPWEKFEGLVADYFFEFESKLRKGQPR